VPQPLFDPSSKWMLEEHGASILYLAGARSALSCKARKAEVVQPRKLPDGLLEARFTGRAGTSLVLVEVATYPEERVVAQVQDDIRLVRQARGLLPEALVLCLCPRGAYRVPDRSEETSGLGWTAAALSWKVVEVWELQAEELLAAPSVGVVPWAPLARYDSPPRCCCGAAGTGWSARAASSGPTCWRSRRCSPACTSTGRTGWTYWEEGEL
jgi:hypothetical protein